MPLSIPLPAGAKIIINGAVLENGGPANISLVVHNTANVLRDKDVLTQKEADTPAKEVYHAIQNAYLFEGNRQEWTALSHALLDRFKEMMPEAEEVVEHIRGLLAEDKLYNALRATRRLIAIEGGDNAGTVGGPVAPSSGGKPSSSKSATAKGGKPFSPKNPTTEGEGASGRQTEIAKIRNTIAELERRVAALDEQQS